MDSAENGGQIAPPPRALVCPHMFSVPSPFASAGSSSSDRKTGCVVISEAWQRGEREVISGPLEKGFLERGGGPGADKNQAWARDRLTLLFTRKGCHAHYVHTSHSVHSSRRTLAFLYKIHAFSAIYLHIAPPQLNTKCCPPFPGEGSSSQSRETPALTCFAFWPLL